MLSSFYDLWSLTSCILYNRSCQRLWIAFKFLWSLVFDILFIHSPLHWSVVNCFQVFMIFGLWHQSIIIAEERFGCELLSSFYDLWSLTSHLSKQSMASELWIAFKFLWSLVFDIDWGISLFTTIVVNCFQVFMIFGLWHQYQKDHALLMSCELLSSFYDLWSLTSQFDQSHNSKGLQDVISIKKRAE